MVKTCFTGKKTGEHSCWPVSIAFLGCIDLLFPLTRRISRKALEEESCPQYGLNTWFPVCFLVFAHSIFDILVVVVVVVVVGITSSNTPNTLFPLDL